MKTFRSTIVLAMFMASAMTAYAEDFPKAPPRLKDAEAGSLARVSTDELKQFMPGKVDSKGPIGRRIKMFKSDGTVDTVGYKSGNAESGTWRFDEANNTYCHRFQGKKGVVDDCFAVFRAPDGPHFFEYNVKTGFLERTWRRVTE